MDLIQILSVVPPFSLDVTMTVIYYIGEPGEEWGNTPTPQIISGAPSQMARWLLRGQLLRSDSQP